MSTSQVIYTYQGVTHEGFRPYEGESDFVNIRQLNSRKRYALVIAICSASKTEHTVWTVIDTEHHLRAFLNFMNEHHPKVNYIRYLRSRT